MYESPKASHKQECSFPWPISVYSTETLPLHSEEPNWDRWGEIQMAPGTSPGNAQKEKQNTHPSY